MAFVLRKFHERLRRPLRAARRCTSVMAFLGTSTRVSAEKPSNLWSSLGHGEPVAVGGDHGERAWLQHEQRAIQRVARLFE